MKHFFLIVTIGAALSAGCSESGIEEAPSTPLIVSQARTNHALRSADSLTLISSFDADQAIIAECGYDTTGMAVHEDYYTVGSDLIFHKSYVAECRLSAQSR